MSLNNWSTAVLVTDVSVSNPINATNNAHMYKVHLEGIGDGATLVPSAISVQIMCPTALQTAHGIVYAGVMNTQSVIGGRTEKWSDYMEQFVEFQNPRLLAASKLALRGVQINSYPLNMAEVSRFSPLAKYEDATFTYTANGPECCGWAPIVIYNPSAAQLELLITVEYRVRFDLTNPASASHTHHKVASDATWDNLTRKATAMGNGVQDIADVVANTGQALNTAYTVGKALSKAFGPSAAAVV